MKEEITRRPLGPNESSSAEGVYEYVGWPAWRYNPETGQGQIFQSADEVPLGWSDIPPGTTPPGEDGAIIVDESRIGAVVTEGGETGQEGAGGAAITDSTDNGGAGDNGDAGDNGQQGRGGATELPEWNKDELAALGQTKLAEILTAMNKDRTPEIEFLPNWSKKKLADTILQNGGYRAAKEA